MKKFFLLITNFHMGMTYTFKDDYIENNSYFSQNNSEDETKILYGLALIVSLINLVIILFNYISISTDKHNLVGLIVNSLQVFVSIFYYIFYKFNLVLLKVITCIYLFFFPWTLIINAFIFNNVGNNTASVLILSFTFLILNLLTGYLTYKALDLQYGPLLKKN